LEHLVPGEAPVGAVELAAGFGGDAGVAPGVGDELAELGLEGDGLGDAADGQLALDLVAVALRGDGGGLEAHLGVVLDVEEVGAAQVLVTAVVAGGDAGGVDLGGDVGGDAALVDGDVDVELLEAAAHGGEAHVLDGELYAAVGLVEVQAHVHVSWRGCRAVSP